MNFVRIVVAKLGKVLLVILATFRRALCCIRRRRRNSDTPLPFVMDVKSSATPVHQSTNSEEAELRNWNSWGTEEDHPLSVTVVDDHGYSSVSSGEVSRANTVYTMFKRQPSNSEGEPDVDYFQDMTPEITRPAKIIIKKHTDHSASNDRVSHRLGVDPQLASGVGAELGNWVETEGSWEESMDSEIESNANYILRESRLLDRERRAADNLKRKQEKEAGRVGKRDHLATKIS